MTIAEGEVGGHGLPGGVPADLLAVFVSGVQAHARYHFPMRARTLLVPAFVLVAACGASRLEPGTVAVGTWGGEESGLIVRADGAHAHIGCTYGDVAGPIPFDGDGRFDVAAVWNVSAFPIDRGVFHDARMSGRLTGRSLTFSARLSDTGQALGPVTVTLGREPRMANCPICRIPRARSR